MRDVAWTKFRHMDSDGNFASYLVTLKCTSMVLRLLHIMLSLHDLKRLHKFANFGS